MDTSNNAPQQGVEAVVPAPPKRRRWLRPALIGAAALIVIIIVTFLALRPAPVTVAEARIGPAIESVYASGVVEYVRQADIAPVVNAPIRRVLVQEGQTVRAGQELVALVDGPEQAQVIQLEAQAAQARERYDRQERLYGRGFAAQAARDDAQRVYQAAAAAARAARENLRDYHIAAPFAGRVLRREAEPGDLARVGTALIVMADVSQVRITADIDERDAGRIAEGQAALVRADAFPGQQFDATLTEITPQGDSTARIFRGRLALAADTALRPGMTVEVNIVIARRDEAVLAPASAVRDGALFVLDGSTARRREVQTGVSGADAIEITSGLSAGERVIADPPEGLKDGARVAPRA